MHDNAPSVGRYAQDPQSHRPTDAAHGGGEHVPLPPSHSNHLQARSDAVECALARRAELPLRDALSDVSLEMR